jgi:peptidoglycan/LPS O-acetylase OafA/YrhL
MGMRFETGPAWLGITWSLAVEEQFYAVLPLLVRVVPFKRLPLLLLACILLAPAFRLSVVALTESPFPAYVLLPGRADALLLGVMCAYIVRQEPLKNLLTRLTRWLYLALGVLFLGIVFLTAQSPSAASLEMVAWGYSLFAIFYTCFLLLAVTERRGIVTAITRNSLLRQLGILAYGVYILHPTIIYFAHAMILQQVPQIRSVPDVLVTLLAFALVLVIASASWALFEKKIVALGHRSVYYEQIPAKSG